MLVETCTIPARASSRPSARTPGSVRTSAAISLAVSSGASISTLKAASGGRAATSVAPAVGCRRAARRRAGARVDAGRPAQLGARAAARELAVEVDGELQLVPSRSARISASAIAAPRWAGLEVDDRRDVDRAHARVRARVRAQVDAGDRLARAGEHALGQLAGLARDREHRAVVVGVGGVVDQAGPERGAIAARASGSRPSETLGTASRLSPRVVSERPTAVVAHALADRATATVRSATDGARWALIPAARARMCASSYGARGDAAVTARFSSIARPAATTPSISPTRIWPDGHSSSVDQPSRTSSGTSSTRGGDGGGGEGKSGGGGAGGCFLRA